MKEPTCCPHCEYDEAEGGLLQQCGACKRADANLLPGTETEQAVIDGHIIEEMVVLNDQFSAAEVDSLIYGTLGKAAALYVDAAALQLDQPGMAEAGLVDAPPCPAGWPFDREYWTATEDPRLNYAKAVALLWLEMIRLERRAAVTGGGAA